MGFPTLPRSQTAGTESRRPRRSPAEGGLLHRLDYETSGIVLFARIPRPSIRSFDSRNAGPSTRNTLRFRRPLAKACRPARRRGRPFRPASTPEPGPMPAIGSTEAPSRPCSTARGPSPLPRRLSLPGLWPQGLARSLLGPGAGTDRSIRAIYWPVPRLAARGNPYRVLAARVQPWRSE